MVLLLGPIASASAQQPPDAGSLTHQQEQLGQGVVEAFPEEGISEVLRPALNVLQGMKVSVQAIRFSGGVGLVPEAKLQALVREAVGKELGFAGLQALAERVTAYLRREGWLLARAYLPRQDITEGKVEITILKGRLEANGGGGGGWRIELDEGARADAPRLAA
ncbi:MAG TPA: POTRA domain-containing protein, partial [Candidatus Sulfotelmatobacter sp.]|nr:POTRA domain-containing protein [Candidatus Sulfotelmatobacter sp.]